MCIKKKDPRISFQSANFTSNLSRQKGQMRSDCFRHVRYPRIKLACDPQCYREVRGYGNANIVQEKKEEEKEKKTQPFILQCY